ELLAGGDDVSGQPELLTCRGLKVVPDDLPIRAEELVAGDLHLYGARVDLLQACAIRPDRPDAVDFVPRAFIAEHDERGVRGRELEVIQPVRARMELLDLARTVIDVIHAHRHE